jgi:hypothetical protein
MGDSNSRDSEGSDFVVDDNNNENIVDILPVDYKADFQLSRTIKIK